MLGLKGNIFDRWVGAVALDALLIGAPVASSHPAHSHHSGQTVIANFPIDQGGLPSPAHMVVANYPINAVSGYSKTASPMPTYTSVHYPAVTVPTIVASATPVPTPMPVVTPVVVHQPVIVQAPVIKTHVIKSAPPVAHHHVTVAPARPVVLALPRHQDCICARSASGGKVDVFRTAGRWQSTPMAKIGGGRKLIDVRGFHQGHWRVSFREPAGGVKYGWVRQGDLVCEDKGAPKARY